MKPYNTYQHGWHGEQVNVEHHEIDEDSPHLTVARKDFVPIPFEQWLNNNPDIEKAFYMNCKNCFNELCSEESCTYDECAHNMYRKQVALDRLRWEESRKHTAKFRREGAQ